MIPSRCAAAIGLARDFCDSIHHHGQIIKLSLDEKAATSNFVASTTLMCLHDK